MPSDTLRALGAGAEYCQSRSLLQERLPFFDDDVEDWKRLSLDLWLTGGNDIIQLWGEREAVRIKQREHRSSGNGKLNAEKLADAEKYVAATLPIAKKRLLTAPRLPNLSWFHQLPANRRAEVKLFTASRLLIGLANGVVENAGLTLHRFFGIPQIPGSAQKGVARDAARELEVPEDQILLIFGNDTEADSKSVRQGAVCFLPAWPENADARMELDVITPHYGDYYGDRVRKLPDQTEAPLNPNALDTENPIPNFIPAVAKGVRFVFRLSVIHPRIDEAAAKDLLNTAAMCLRYGLTHTGIGAKTRAGYGGFTRTWDEKHEMPASDLFPELGEHIPKPLSRVQRVISEWQGRQLGSFSFQSLCSDLVTLDDDELKKAWESIIPEDQKKNFRMVNPFWKDFVSRKNPDGPKVLERLGLRF